MREPQLSFGVYAFHGCQRCRRWWHRVMSFQWQINLDPQTMGYGYAGCHFSVSIFKCIFWKEKYFDSNSLEFVHWGLIDQSHRYGRPQAACGEPAGSYDKTTRTAICFEHKTQYLLIRAPYTRIVVFWHNSNIPPPPPPPPPPPMISQSQISCNTPTFHIAAIFVKYCYTTGSWLL